MTEQLAYSPPGRPFRMKCRLTELHLVSVLCQERASARPNREGNLRVAQLVPRPLVLFPFIRV